MTVGHYLGEDFGNEYEKILVYQHKKTVDTHKQLTAEGSGTVGPISQSPRGRTTTHIRYSVFLLSHAQQYRVIKHRYFNGEMEFKGLYGTRLNADIRRRKK